MNLFDLSGKTALVTGSSQGLGFAMATGLAQAGARVVLNGRNREKLDLARDRLRAQGLDVEAVPFDVTDETAVDRAVAEIESGIGPIDVLVNNAGVNLRGAIEKYDTQTWRRLMSLNVDAVFFMSRAVGRYMIERQRGKVINTASLLSERARPSIAPYTASKGAVKLFTMALAVEWAPHNIQVNAIGPGYFDTEMTRPLIEDAKFDRWVKERTPAGRWGQPRELIGAAVFFASTASDFVTGQILYVDGGWLAAV